MDNSYIDRHCANCAFKFRNPGQIFKKIKIVDEITNLKPREISILDAVLYIYGLSSSNLASACLDDATTPENVSFFARISETRDFITKHGLAVCGNCVSVFKEVYVAFYGLKALSNKMSILSKTIKKFSPTFIKIENDFEIEGTARKSSRASSSAHLRESTPESYAEETDDLFQEFSFENHCDSYENEEHDIKPDPISDTGFQNFLDVSATVDSEPEEDCNRPKKRKCRRDKDFILKFASKTKRKDPDDSLPATRTFTFTFTKSNKGRDILVDEEKNTYEFSKPGLKGKKIWRCTKYYTLDKCKGRCHTIGDEMKIITPHTHVHSESARDLQRREFKNKIKDLASITSNTPEEIVASALQEKESIAPEANLPNSKALISSINYARRKSKVSVNQSDSIAAIDTNVIRTFTLTKSKKGGDILVDEEKNTYEFCKPGLKGKRIWKCTKYYSDKCKGRCHTIGDEMKMIAPHTHVNVHSESVRDLQIREFKNKIKDMASITSNTPEEIIAAALQEKDSIAPGASLPNSKALINSIKYARRKSKVAVDPESSNDLVTSPQSENM